MSKATASKPAKKTDKKKPAGKKGAGGRPSSYRPEYVPQVEKLCLLGATDKDLAGFFGVSEQTLNSWKKRHPEFLESLKRGKQVSDTRVVQSLFQRAIGYSHSEEKVFCNSGKVVRAQTQKHYPPDPTSAIFWLKNRDPDRWREKQQHEVSLAETVMRDLFDLPDTTGLPADHEPGGVPEVEDSKWRGGDDDAAA